MPSDIEKLYDSFRQNKFKERVISPTKVVYKRGATLALEFNYNSEAIEIQVILEQLGNRLKISVGNWGFPFEPLLMKSRFTRNLDLISKEIQESGALPIKLSEAAMIEQKSKRASRLAVTFLICTAIGVVVYAIAKNT